MTQPITSEKQVRNLASQLGHLKGMLSCLKYDTDMNNLSRAEIGIELGKILEFLKIDSAKAYEQSTKMFLEGLGHYETESN